MNQIPFKINWKTKAKHFDSAIARLMQQSKLCDVTIMCEGQMFKAHQLILCICSEYFETVLEDVSATQHPIIFLRDVTANECQYMLDYMYKGEVIVPERMLSKFLETCKLLHIEGLYYDENTQSKSTEGEVRVERSPSKTPPKRKKPDKRPQVRSSPRLVQTDKERNSENSEQITLVDVEADKGVERTDGSNVLESPPHSPNSLVFSFNKLPETSFTSDSLIVHESQTDEIIILSDDIETQRQNETQSDSYFTPQVDQNTFMQSIELQEKSTVQSKSLDDSDGSEVVIRRKYTRIAKNKDQTYSETSLSSSNSTNKEEAIQNAQKLKVILPKISQDRASDRLDTSDESERPREWLKRQRLWK